MVQWDEVFEARDSTRRTSELRSILTPEERAFLEVFLQKATTSPFFNGPATKALHGIGVEYTDISYISWAYEQDVPRTRFEF